MQTILFKASPTLFLLALLAQTLSAQITDDFSDGEFTSNPAWQGDTANFKVSAAYELQLDAPAAGSSSLYLPAGLPDAANWEIYARMEFDPSNANRLRIYLFSDSPNLANGSGYFLQIGEDGAADAVKLYRQDAGKPNLLASATSAAVATAPHVRLKVSREGGANWKLEADYAGGDNFTQEFEATDDAYGADVNGFFGLQCTYSATRKDKFFFDDILLPEPIPDTLPPALLAAEAVSALEVDVFFNEPLDEMSATEPANFSIDKGIGEPAAAFLDDEDQRIVHLSLSSPLVNLTDYILTTKEIGDVSDNISATQTAAFSYVLTEEADEFDILINEIMADPTPPVALPQVEFIELFNRSNKVIDLAGFTYSNGGAPQVFPSYKMMPGSYVIVCDDSYLGELSAFGTVVDLTSFPSLPNDGAELTLRNPAGKVIHYVNYNIAWYKNSQKAQGGWTLELVNPLSPCEGESNWRASTSLSGGTPGKPNSVLVSAADETQPELIRVFASPNTPDEIVLFFDKRMNRSRAENPANYQITPEAEISDASLQAPADNAVFIKLDLPLKKSILYHITALNAIADCIGNVMGAANTLPLAIPELPDPQDLVVNEILFNPETGGSDFLEIYNRSGKIFNLSDLSIGNIFDGEDTVIVKVAEDRLIFPEEYVVFSEKPQDILSRYKVENPNSLILNSLPPFKDKAGNATILRAESSDVVIIDAFDYQESMHSPLLKDLNGVSLERLNPDRPAQNRSNWHSAAETAGYATPSYHNSQFFDGAPDDEDFFQIPEPTFSPDGDGYKDFLPVLYQTDKSGYSATIKIFDSEGRLVKSLASNELLATEGFFRWDGDDDKGAKARMGIYVVWIQLFNPDGSRRVFKKACVLAGRL